MRIDEALRRLRMEIGDPARSFDTNSIGDGMTSDYDLPKQNIDDTSLVVTITNGSVVTTLTLGQDYQLNANQGFIRLTSPVPFGAIFSTSGKAWGLFTDRELRQYVEDSLLQHCQGRTVKERIRTYRGFISY